MLKFITTVILAVSLVACGGTFTVHPTPTAEQVAAEPGKYAGYSLDNYDVDITAAARSLKKNKLSFSDADYKKFSDAIRQARDYSDEARNLLEVGDLTGEAAKIKLLQNALSIVQGALIQLQNKGK